MHDKYQFRTKYTFAGFQKPVKFKDSLGSHLCAMKELNASKLKVLLVNN